MNRKTNRVLGIVFAFLINLGVYVSLVWMSVLITNKLEGDNHNFLLGLLNGLVVYSIFLKIKPFRVQKLLEKYSEELMEERFKK